MKAKTTKLSGDSLLPLLFEMGRVMKRELASENILAPSWLHLETLRFISEFDNPAMSDVADYLKIAPPTATALVNGLVDDGFLKRSADDKDRRRVLLEVTPKGKRCITDAAKKRERAFLRVVSPLSDAERIQFAHILSIITRKP